MSTDIQKGQQLFDAFRKNPLKTIIIIATLTGLTWLVAWGNGYFSETGRQQAIDMVQPNKQKSSEQEGKVIEQSTKGDQSPAVVSDEVTINYDSHKNDKP